MKILMCSCIALLLSLNTVAEENHPSPEMIDTAKRVVELYQDLRSKCASMESEGKRTCFKQLKKANNSYRNAKKLLLSVDGDSFSKGHLLTFAQ